jgi:transmembrane 9 superfamily protein 2/4
MTVCTMVCALLGLTSPANRGGLLTTLLMLFVAMGSFAGYDDDMMMMMFTQIILHAKNLKLSSIC